MSMHRRWRGLVALACAGLLVGCATEIKPPPAGGAAAPVSPGAPSTVPGTTEAAPAPESSPAPATLPALPPAGIAKAIASAIEALEQGQEDSAEMLLRQVLQADAGHRQALALLRQITEEPASLYGRESFAYRVQPGESLSSIAKRFLGDAYQFYGLARLNGIKVPRLLAGGQMIRVPGKAPAAGVAPPALPHAPPPAPPSAPPHAPPATPPAAPPTAPPPASAPAAPATPAAETAASAAARAEREKADTIARLTRAARSASAKQDLNGAIRLWDQVLALDPNHRIAILERQKAVDLRERLGRLPR